MKNRTSQPKESLPGRHYIILGESGAALQGVLPTDAQPKVQCYLCRRAKDSPAARFNQGTKEIETYPLEFGSVSSLVEHAEGGEVSFLYTLCAECLALLKAITTEQAQSKPLIPQSRMEEKAI